MRVSRTCIFVGRIARGEIQGARPPRPCIPCSEVECRKILSRRISIEIYVNKTKMKTTTEMKRQEKMFANHMTLG